MYTFRSSNVLLESRLRLISFIFVSRATNRLVMSKSMKWNEIAKRSCFDKSTIKSNSCLIFDELEEWSNTYLFCQQMSYLIIFSFTLNARRQQCRRLLHHCFDCFSYRLKIFFDWLVEFVHVEVISRKSCTSVTGRIARSERKGRRGCWVSLSTTSRCVCLYSIPWSIYFLIL